MHSVNVEQLGAISAVLTAYREGRMSLARLSGELSAGQYGFVDPPRTWTEEFMRHWAIIEEVNAVQLDGVQISEVTRELLEQAVDDLRELVNAHLP